jgi:oxygen-independent coproporphyrinogen-3 oxidase
MIINLKGGLYQDMKGLYIHIPFCVKKCDYCDFVSFSGKEDLFEGYVDALSEEMKEYTAEEVDTIFIGGGTPSVLPPKLIKRLCGEIKNNFKLTYNTEWTAEANPGTLSDEKIYSMLEGGINRISVGVQSFDDNELRAAGRIHSARCAYDTVNNLAALGFKNISIDLMESLPLQTEESFKNSLKTAVSLPISHISVYSLIIEDNTPIKKKYDDGVYSLPDEESDRRLYAFTKEYLADYGFNRYEISNYAKDGACSRHNLKYWDCGEYIGLGAAAHSYLNGRRFSNTSDLNAYLSGNFHSGESELLTQKSKQGEFMMLGLRKTAGVERAEFERRFGENIEDVYGDILQKYIKTGFMIYENGFYRLSDSGTDVANYIMCDFV